MSEYTLRLWQIAVKQYLNSVIFATGDVVLFYYLIIYLFILFYSVLQGFLYESEYK